MNNTAGKASSAPLAKSTIGNTLQCSSILNGMNHRRNEAKEKFKWDVCVFEPGTDGITDSIQFDLEDTLLVELVMNWDKHRDVIHKLILCSAG